MVSARWLPAGLVLAAVCFAGSVGSGAQSRASDREALLRSAVKEGRIAYKLTETEEIRTLLGPPAKESSSPDGEWILISWEYPEVTVTFGRWTRGKAPLVLLGINKGEEEWDIGRGRKLALRSEKDMAKLDSFSGVQNVDLKRLNLRSMKEALASMTFDSLTEWPAPDKLPAGFDPAAVLELGKNPGLGVRGLHKENIDGRGVGIAVIDQPLLLGHEQYASGILRFDATGMTDVPPQMHGPAVLSAAAGLTCGVAPKAAITYFAVPMWENSNRPYVAAMNRIFELNASLPPGEKIRAVSISTGMFRNYPEYETWKAICERAAREGIFLITCDGTLIEYGMLGRSGDGDPDDLRSYRPGLYSRKSDKLRVPGTRTLASYRANSAYTYFPEGGMSWGAPYLAGLAALAFQVNPKASPGDVVAALLETAVMTEAGPVVNPRGFIDRLRR